MITTKNHPEAIKNFRKAIADWDSCYVPEVYKKDRKDLRKVLNAFRLKDRVKARELTQQLDTIVRDQIPSNVWDWIKNTSWGI